jgi:hypothetical protein
MNFEEEEVFAAGATTFAATSAFSFNLEHSKLALCQCLQIKRFEV